MTTFHSQTQTSLSTSIRHSPQTASTTCLNEVMRVWRFPLLLAACLMSFGFAGFAAEPSRFATLQIEGATLTNAIVTSVNPVQLVISHDGGRKTLKRQDLPIALEALFPYDSKAAIEYEEQQEAVRIAQVKRLQQRQAENLAAQRESHLKQRNSLQLGLEGVDKQIERLDTDIRLAWNKAKGRPRSPARQEYNRLIDQKRALEQRRFSLRESMDRVDKQISTQS